MDSTQGDCLYLQGELARDFFHYKIGETVKITVTAVLRKTAMESPSVEEEYPVAEFEVLDVTDQPNKDYANMSNADMEAQIHNVKYEDQPEEPTTIPNREDGGSIWLDQKRQDKVSRTPQRRPRPFRIG